jgi:hypothetical protein
MKKEEQLLRDVTELVKQTKEGKIEWDILCQTSEYNDPATKPVETEDGETWIVDECFVSYHCPFQGKEFLLVTYEQIYTCGDRQKSCNLIFEPPLGIRFFDVDILAPYALEADQMLLYEIHMLWLTLLEQYKKQPEQIHLNVTQRELVLER